jgi:aminoglycoside phosphotransferase (APT) family kinase protein
MMAKSKELKAYEEIARRIVPEGNLVRIWSLAGGISAEMIVLEIDDGSGRMRRVIVRRSGPSALKQNPNIVKNEHDLLVVLKQNGLPVPEPLHLDLSTRILPAPYLVLEYIDGQIDYAPTSLHDCMHQLAGQLVKIHTLNIAGQDFTFLPQQSQITSSRLGIRPGKLNHELHEGIIRETLEAAWPFAERNPAALLHGDYWPGNVLWRSGTLTGVVDWEDASLGDPLYDLAIARLDLLYIFGLEAMTAFTDYYRSSRAIDDIDLPYWDLYAALRFIRLTGSELGEWAAFFHPYGRRDIRGKTIREYYQFFVHQAFDRLGLEI